MAVLWKEGEGPRERLLTEGATKLGTAELIAVLLGHGTAGRGALAIGAELVEWLGGLEGLEQVGPRELARIGGIGSARAARLLAAVELGRRVCARPVRRDLPLNDGAQVFARYGPMLRGERNEVFMTLALDARNRPVGEFQVARGTLTTCEVHPREVFRPLVRACAAKAVFIHNHPSSGDPEPSANDLALTASLKRAGELLQIPVIDHVIVAERGFVSFEAEGLL